MPGVDVHNASDKVVTVSVLPIEWPHDGDAHLSNGEVLNLSVTMQIKPTPEFHEWAEVSGIPYSLSFSEDGKVIVHLESEEHGMWFKLRWM